MLTSLPTVQEESTSIDNIASDSKGDLRQGLFGQELESHASQVGYLLIGHPVRPVWRLRAELDQLQVGFRFRYDGIQGGVVDVL